MIFAYNFFSKKYEINFCVVYVFHIILLHTCLAIQHYIDVLDATQLCCILTYATYYSLVACFATLIVVCKCFWRHLNDDASNEDIFDCMGRATELQDLNNGHQQPTEPVNRSFDRQQNKKYTIVPHVFAFTVPLVLTIVVFAIDSLKEVHSFNQCFRIQFEIQNLNFDYAIVPILAFMAFGIIALYLITIRLDDVDKRNHTLGNKRMRYENYWFYSDLQ